MLEEPNIELEDVKSAQTPPIILAGEHDIFKPETFVRLEAAMPNATQKILPGYEHDSYITQYDMLYPDLLSFLT